MRQEGLVLLLAACVALLLALLLAQRLLFRRRVQSQLGQLTRQLSAILDGEGGGQAMLFTDDAALAGLLEQINRLLRDRQRITAQHRRTEAAARRMLANISHDIRTPMTVILGYLEILRLRSPQDAALCRVEGRAKQLMEQMEQFFALAKLEAGDTALTLAAVDLSEICREAVLDHYALLTRAAFQVELDIPDAAVLVQGDAASLRRILHNLLSNALRYGQEGRYLGVKLCTDGEAACVQVIDHGQGLEPAAAAHAFERLYRQEDAKSQGVQGSGLGLAIAKNLAVQMGGDLTLESLPHRETVFALRVRRAPAAERKL